MARRKLEKNNIRKLAKMGKKSVGLTLPIEIVRKLKWRDGQKVVVSVHGKTITVKDWPVGKR